MGEDRISRSDREIYAMTARSRLIARKRRPPPADPVEQPALRVHSQGITPPATAISSHNPDCAKIVPIAPMTLENR